MRISWAGCVESHCGGCPPPPATRSGAEAQAAQRRLVHTSETGRSGLHRTTRRACQTRAIGWLVCVTRRCGTTVFAACWVENDATHPLLEALFPKQDLDIWPMA